MADQHKDNDKPAPKTAKDDKPVVVTSDAGETHPPQVFGGDGVTPIHEWPEKIKGLKEKQAEHDKKMRDRAIEHSGTMITTEKGK